MGQARLVAKEYANLNGRDLTTVSVDVEPTLITTFATKTFSSLFARVVGIDTFTVKAHATAQAWCRSGRYGVIALNESKCQSLFLEGGFDVHVINGDVIVNSTCTPNAVEVYGSEGSLVADGNFVTGAARDPHGAIQPPPIQMPPVPDPYAAIDTPNVSPPAVSPSQCTWGSDASSVAIPPGTYNCPTGFQIAGNNPVVFAGGEYAFIGGMTIQGNSGLVTFGHGTYVFRSDNGDGFAYTGGRSIDATAGALFYNTCKDGSCGSYSVATGCASTDTSGRFLLEGSGSITVAPYKQLGKDYSNVVFFQDRCSTTGADFSGSSTQLTLKPTGAIYAKSANVDYGGSATGGLQIVSDTISIRGSAYMNIDVTEGEKAPPLVVWSLVE